MEDAYIKITKNLTLRAYQTEFEKGIKGDPFVLEVEPSNLIVIDSHRGSESVGGVVFPFSDAMLASKGDIPGWDLDILQLVGVQYGDDLTYALTGKKVIDKALKFINKHSRE